MFGNDKLSRMTNFRERQIFGYDEFLGGIFLTFNLLPIASFRIGVLSILLILKKENMKTRVGGWFKKATKHT